MHYYDYSHFQKDVLALTSQCRTFQADTIVAIARGGMTLAHALAMSLNLRNVQTIRSESYDGQTQRETIRIIGSCDLSGSKRVLIVDDIVDSGKTMSMLLELLRKQYPFVEFKSLAIFTKQTAVIQPDFSLREATDWIDFFWERDFLTEPSV